MSDKINKAEIISRISGMVELTLDELTGFQGNLKRLGQREREKLINSIMKHNFSDPFLIWQSNGKNLLLDGHSRLSALCEMRERDITLPTVYPCIVVDVKDEKEAKEILLHVTSSYGKITRDGFKTFTQELNLESLGSISLLQGSPFTLKPLKSSAISDDDLSDIKDTDIEDGDVFVINDFHYLVCGDSTLEKTYKAFPQLAHLIVTDPPYNVNYVAKQKFLAQAGISTDHGHKDIENDNIENFYQFLYDAFTAMQKSLAVGGSVYVFFAMMEVVNFYTALKNAGLPVHQSLTWVKNGSMLGRQDYSNKTENIAYCWREGDAHNWYGGNNDQTTVLEFDKPRKSKEHPTMKPVALVQQLILNNTLPSNIVLDPFCGSGTTMLASIKNNRIGYGIEKDPHYCQVILDRLSVWCEENEISFTCEKLKQ